MRQNGGTRMSVTSAKHLKVSVAPAVFAAIQQMANATKCGPEGGITAQSFVGELLEVAVISEYEKRFGQPISRAPISVELES